MDYFDINAFYENVRYYYKQEEEKYGPVWGFKNWLRRFHKY